MCACVCVILLSKCFTPFNCRLLFVLKYVLFVSLSMFCYRWSFNKTINQPNNQPSRQPVRHSVSHPASQRTTHMLPLLFLIVVAVVYNFLPPPLTLNFILAYFVCNVNRLLWTCNALYLFILFISVLPTLAASPFATEPWPKRVLLRPWHTRLCKFMYFLLCLGSRFGAFIQPSCVSGRLTANQPYCPFWLNLAALIQTN